MPATANKSWWYVPSAFYMKKVPVKRTDLVQEVQSFDRTDPPCCFDTETEAVDVAIERLVVLKGHAEASIKAYSKPAKSMKRHVRQRILAGARLWHKVAMAGLKLLDVSPEEVEEREGVRPVNKRRHDI